ncbi:MAG: hypothetical protein PHU34_11370 [Candidatus Methanoperedens sp.]|nr:hypothetical protein [Candidatus Methanoperedens sp.]
MKCTKCGSTNIIKKGTYMNSKGEMQTRQCVDCGKTKSELIK